ncbi:GL16233 [Drosophila persimilis]|uniref:GL16233 n=1 Tax=Drosophila persimilis TaxID=7234 RepID=B4HBJ3_DROPE|nr:GL16233 [Drosophila persimilis]
METKRLTHEDRKKKMEDLRAFLGEQQAIVGEGGYRAEAPRQRRASVLSRGDEEDWCDGSQFLQLLASPLVSPAPSGHDSVSPTVSSDEGAGESEDDVICIDGPRAPTAQEKARVRRPLTPRDRGEALKRKFQEATAEEKRRIRRVLEAARMIRRRRDERLEARAATGGKGHQEGGALVLPPMQSRADEAGAEGAQLPARGERATNPEAEWQRRLQQAEDEEGELWQPTPPAEDEEGPERRPPQIEEEQQQQHQQQPQQQQPQQQQQHQHQQHQQQQQQPQQQQQHQHQQRQQQQQQQQQQEKGQWQQQPQWRGPEAAVIGPYVSQEVRTAVRQGMVWHHQTLHITWASGPAPCETQPETGARVWEESPLGSNNRDPRRRNPKLDSVTTEAEEAATDEAAAGSATATTAAGVAPAEAAEAATNDAAEGSATATTAATAEAAEAATDDAAEGSATAITAATAEGPAKMWFDSSPVLHTTWNNFAAAIQDEFESNPDDAEVHFNMANATRRSKETVKEYCFRMSALDVRYAGSIMRQSFAQQINADRQRCSMKIRGICGGSCILTEAMVVDMDIDEKIITAKVYGAEDDLLQEDFLLGQDVIISAHLSLKFEPGDTEVKRAVHQSIDQERNQMRSLLEKFANVFAMDCKA